MIQKKLIRLRLTKIDNLAKKFSDYNYEFHISKNARKKYQFNDDLFSLSGNVIFADFYSVRLFSSKINEHLDLVNFPEKAIKAGQLNALGLIDEILHYVVSLYKEEKNKNIFNEILLNLYSELGKENVENTLIQFVEEFPPQQVYKTKIDVQEYLSKKGNRELALEELLNLFLANSNPAFDHFNELFDDSNLCRFSSYRKINEIIENYFKTQATFGPQNQYLIDMLRSPSLNVPHSLSGQLEYIRTHWGLLLSSYMMKLFGGLDLISEENKVIFTGPGPSLVQDFKGSDLLAHDEPERFSNDLDWMPNVIMIAKSTYVWLDQLSKKYKQNIFRLDQIPDEELDLLSSRGFTALWLIGLWERSPSSQKIKNIMGNPEAVSSAYSLYDYIIANDLGGEEAYQNLKDRTWQRGIRLASDMVPNHTGIFSKWIIEHPDWFIQVDNPPYPNYSFNGENLSQDDRVSIMIEDGYWNRSDAAVVFKYVNNHSGETKYIYHGNDGTGMPWNDTAQLNYLKSEVRESVIQTILHVARKFPIIRFDAAMTLAKKHYQRLWFPQPGSGGDIPSRSEHALSREQFDQLFPVEFWREVVDRVAQEVPETLLLAEAFWMMEGYFVRTLGMHRVYNSAFMNMLKNEENSKYRQSIKNVLDFNPGILKRYVNFMNNPDEDTAVAQFGKDDKYFGVCIVMATMPGLPMFGHGQIEGFSEKYGMEYRKAYWNETEDQYLLERHEREIFPILKKRFLFSEVDNFVLYDFISVDGSVNENVFAYTNGTSNEKALVIYNNKFDEARGRVHFSSATAQKDGDSFNQASLAQSLNLNYTDNYYCIFKDQVSGLEYIRNNKSLLDEGLYTELGAFKYHVFVEFRQIEDNEYNHYRDLANYLNGRGVPDIQEALKETFLSPVHYPFKEIINIGFFNFISDSLDNQKNKKKALEQFEQKITNLFNEITKFQKQESINADIISQSIKNLDNIYNLKIIIKKYKDIDLSQYLPVLIAWITIHNLSKIFTDKDQTLQSLALLDDWLFGKIINHTFLEVYNDEAKSAQYYLLLKILLSHPDWMNKADNNLPDSIECLFSKSIVSRFLQFNRYHEILYLNAENFKVMLSLLLLLNLITEDYKKEKMEDIISVKNKLIIDLDQISKKAGYRVNTIIEECLKLK